MRHLAPRLVVVSSFLLSLLLVAASLVVVSLFAGSSSAAPATGNGNGATQGPTSGPIDIHHCDNEGSVTFCTTIQGEFHGVCTPTGNCNEEENLHSICFTLTDNVTGDTISSGCGSSHYQTHNKLGETQLLHYSTSSTSTDASGLVCTYDLELQQANGQVQYDQSSYSCTQPPATPVP